MGQENHKPSLLETFALLATVASAIAMIAFALRGVVYIDATLENRDIWQLQEQAKHDHRCKEAAFHGFEPSEIDKCGGSD